MTWNALLRLTTAACVTVISLPALAEGPADGQVVAGQASISRPDINTTQVDQLTGRAVIDWRTFDVDADHHVKFNQPDAQAVILNRIRGGAPSVIMGQVTANGTVVLVNPDGILFGKGSVIDVGGLIATTSNIQNEGFMAGRYQFSEPGNPQASIVNEGLITAREGGVAALVAPAVRNSGVIGARLGRVGLASANTFTLDLYGDNLINLKIDDAIIDQVIDVATGQQVTALVDNDGTVRAPGGQIALSAVTARRVVESVINNDGVIEANSVGLRNGKIVLGAQTSATKLPHAPVQKVRVSGEIRASGQQSGQTGGNIHIVGEMIGLSRATIDATGPAGGGMVFVGGDIQGGNATEATLARYGLTLEEQGIPTATNVSVDRASLIDASATEAGNGGQIIAWADDTMEFAGTVNAKGGQLGGDGGFAEVSGWKQLMFAEIDADLTAPNGTSGIILFDPEILQIDQTHANALADALNLGTNASVTGERIEVTGNILKTAGGDATLAMFADDGIKIAEGILIGSSSGKLNLLLDANADLTDPDGEVNQAAQRFVTNLGVELQQAAFDHALNTPFDDTNAASVRAFADGLLHLLRDSDLPTREDLEIEQLVALMIRRGDMTADEQSEHQASVVTNNGNLYLNGGVLSSVGNSGTAKILGDRLPEQPYIIQDSSVPTYRFSFTPDDSALELATGLELTASVTSSHVSSALPGAQVIDLRPSDPKQISRQYSAYDFGTVVSLGRSYNQTENELLNLINQTGFLVLTEAGFQAVSELAGTLRAIFVGVDPYQPDANPIRVAFNQGSRIQSDGTRGALRPENALETYEDVGLVVDIGVRAPRTFAPFSMALSTIAKILFEDLAPAVNRRSRTANAAIDSATPSDAEELMRLERENFTR